MTTIMPSALNNSQIVDLVDMIMMINTTRAIILTITIRLATVAVSHKKESAIFVAKKVVALIDI